MKNTLIITKQPDMPEDMFGEWNCTNIIINIEVEGQYENIIFPIGSYVSLSLNKESEEAEISWDCCDDAIIYPNNFWDGDYYKVLENISEVINSQLDVEDILEEQSNLDDEQKSEIERDDNLYSFLSNMEDQIEDSLGDDKDLDYDDDCAPYYLMDTCLEDWTTEDKNSALSYLSHVHDKAWNECFYVSNGQVHVRDDY